MHNNLFAQVTRVALWASGLDCCLLDIYNSWIRLNNYKVAVPKNDLANIKYKEIIDGVKLVPREYYDDKTGIRRL